MIHVGVADSKKSGQAHPAEDVGLDCSGAREAGRRMYAEVPVGPCAHGVETPVAIGARRRHINYFIGGGVEPAS